MNQSCFLAYMSFPLSISHLCLEPQQHKVPLMGQKCFTLKMKFQLDQLGQF
jgi:hypothetical protein